MTNLWSPWSGRVKQGRGKAAVRKRPRVLPRLEALEERMVPSSMLTVNTTMDTNAVNPAVSALDSSGNISLRSAIERANIEGGDTITTPAGDYKLSLGALSITNSVTIEGAGAATTLIDAQQMDRVMTVASGAGTVTLQGLTLENGAAPATGGSGDLRSQDSGGGAILDEGATNLNIVNSVLTNNTAEGANNTNGANGGFGEGGAVYQYGGTLTFTDSTVSNNHADGGAGAVSYGGGVGAGGGVYTVLGQLVVQSSTFSGNQADGGNATGFALGGAGQGGAIDYATTQSGVNLTVADSTFSGNTAQGGSFTGGEGFGGAGEGGAFYDATSANITDSTIADNSAMGGAVTQPTGVVEPTGAPLANGAGGGYFFAGGEGTTASIGGTIIAKNSASGVENAVEDVQPQLPPQINPDVFTTNPNTNPFTSLGNNLIGVNAQTTDGFANGTHDDQVGGTTSATQIDPLLGLLQNNGGPTDTMAITSASPAHNTGAAFGLTTDQRGFARTIAGLTDVGAFELDVTPPTAILNAANGVGASGAGANTTTVVVTYSSTDSGVNPASFGTGNITVNNGATVTGFSASGDVVTYTVQAPDSNWANSPQGPYTISLVAGSVTNNDGTGIVGVPDFGTFNVNTAVPVVVPKFFAVAAGSGSSQVNVYNASTGALMTSFLAFGPGVSGVSVAVGDVLGNGTQDIIVGAGPGNAPDVEIIDGSKLNQLNAAGQIEFSALIGGRDFFAFSTSDPTGVNVAVGRVNNLVQPFVGTGPDTGVAGPLDVILGAGPGGGPVVEVIDGTKLLSNGGQLNIDPTTHQIEFGALIGGRDFFAYAPTFTGGVTVAAGAGAVIVGAGPGGNSEVKVVDGSRLGQLDGSNEIAAGALLSDFLAFGSGFTGGASVGFGVTSSGAPELVVAAESGGGPDVEVIDASKINGLVGATPVPFSDLIGGHDFYAYNSTFGGGVSVSVQDVNGDGLPDVIAAPGAAPGQGGSPQQVEVIDGSKVAQDAAAGQVASADLVFASFFPFGPLFNGGVASGAVVR